MTRTRPALTIAATDRRHGRRRPAPRRTATRQAIIAAALADRI